MRLLFLTALFSTVFYLLNFSPLLAVEPGWETYSGLLKNFEISYPGDLIPQADNAGAEALLLFFPPSYMRHKEETANIRVGGCSFRPEDFKYAGSVGYKDLKFLTTGYEHTSRMGTSIQSFDYVTFHNNTCYHVELQIAVFKTAVECEEGEDDGMVHCVTTYNYKRDFNDIMDSIMATLKFTN